MARSVIYAVGGTGAKLVEALIHLCVAGLVRESIAVRIIDQDETNGNVKRLRTLIGHYNAIRSWLRFENGGLSANCPLFLPEIEGANEVLRVLPDVSATLANAYGLSALNDAHIGDNDLLMQTLFSPQERTGHMVNGFRGQPAVGAAAFLSPTSRAQSRLWATVRQDEREARDGEIRRFLFLGSIFGGTGAAGVPTLAGFLRHCSRGAPRPPRVGAVLMLRYYDIENRGEFGPALPAQVRAALEFYMQALRVTNGDDDERLIERLYLVGLSRELSVMPDMQGGGDAQSNPALMPELIGALAGASFLADSGTKRAPDGVADTEPSSPIWLCGHAQPDRVTWADLPAVFTEYSLEGRVRQGSNYPSDAPRLLCSLARFALCYTFGLHSASSLSAIPYVADLPAYFRFLDQGQLARGGYDERAAAVKDYCVRFLRWFAAMHYTANAQDWPRGGGIRLNLSDADALVVQDREHPDRFQLRIAPEKLDESTPDDRDRICRLFESFRIGESAPSLTKTIDRLATVRRPKSSTGLGALIACAYHVAALPE
jgi:hypothetical protein